MCFERYRAYTCGHTSPATLHPCPQTTAFPTSRVCNQPARCPYLVPTMCAACSRTMHNRWVHILEQDHRWMHEQGACDCAVEFPDLMQPRMVVGGGRCGSHGAMSADGMSCAVSGGGSPAPAKQPSSRNNNNHQQHHHQFNKKNNRRGGGSGKQGRRGGRGGQNQHYQGSNQYQQTSNQQQTKAQKQKEEFPAVKEIQEGDKVRYAVRLPSLYGVEWAWDHEKLHKDGKCDCNVAFGGYNPNYGHRRQIQGMSTSGAGQFDTFNSNNDNNTLLGGQLSFSQVLAQASSSSSALAPSFTMPSAAALEHMLSEDNKPRFNPAEPARWTCNPPAGYWNDKEVLMPPPLPTTMTTTTTTGAERGPIIAYGSNTSFTEPAFSYRSGDGDNNNPNSGDVAGTSTSARNPQPQPQPSGDDNDIGYGNPPRPVDMQTVWIPIPTQTQPQVQVQVQPQPQQQQQQQHHQDSTTRSSLLSLSPSQQPQTSQGEQGLQIGIRADGSLVALPQPQQQQQQQQHSPSPPLLGFPIGAGPEGDSHAGPWEECALYQRVRWESETEEEEEVARELGRPSSTSF